MFMCAHSSLHGLKDRIVMSSTLRYVYLDDKHPKKEDCCYYYWFDNLQKTAKLHSKSALHCVSGLRLDIVGQSLYLPRGWNSHHTRQLISCEYHHSWSESHAQN